MKRVVKVLLIVILVFLIVSYFIPTIRQNEIPITNTFENTVSSLIQPKDWIKWDPSVRDAWQKDSSACRFLEDTAKHTITIEIPGKKISVYQASSLNYQLEETMNHKTVDFVLAIAPYRLNKQSGSKHNSSVAYAWNSSLLYKIFPFLEGGSFAKETTSGLSSYLNDPDRFYGFPIKIKPASDTLFITLKKAMAKQELFKKLPVLFDSLDQYSRQNHLRSNNRNVAFTSVSNDSLELLAGINIDKIIDGDYLFRFMQMAPHQILAVAYFEGPFRDRPKVYEAMKKYLYDHILVTQGICFEKYLSPLPVSDSSIIKIELAYPLRTSF